MEQANSVDQFLKLLERFKQYKGVFFRGQSEKYSTISPSISRDKGYYENEHLIFEETIRLKKEEFEVYKWPIEKLAKMQHFGIPTRLVDVTIDPLVALFFAIQNVDDENAGNVYVFIQNGHSLDSKHVRLLSLVSTLSDLSIEKIKKAYESNYIDYISEEEILVMIQNAAFIEYTEELKKTNSRLFNQKGTFVICGNEICEGKISRTIRTIDKVIPNIVIRIPYEYKNLVKKELDEKYGINETMIYPELPSVANYIKEKYKHDNFNIDGTYSIVETKDISHAGAKRISIIVVLEKPLKVEYIKQVAKSIIEKQASSKDVVWIYVAKNSNDYIMSNWVLRGQWISNKLETKYRPLPIGNSDGDGYYWDESKSYSTLGDYYSENVFDDDKDLFVYHDKIFEGIKAVYDILQATFNSSGIDEFTEVVNKHKKFINRYYNLLGEFGHSRDKNFDDFLENYSQAALFLDNIQIWVNRKDLNERTKKYQILRCLEDAKRYIDAIENERPNWVKKLNVTKSDYENINFKSKQKKEYQYKQTLPLNPNALIVKFNIEIVKNADNTFYIKGITNLYDKANIMLSVKDINGQLRGQSKTEVINGCFEFETFSDNGAGYSPGLYLAEIIVPIPSVQPQEFILKAGIEYENLAGEYMDRTGIGPTLKYVKEFII